MNRVLALAGLVDLLTLVALLVATRDALAYVAFHNRTTTLRDAPLDVLGDALAQQAAVFVAIAAPFLAACGGLTLTASRWALPLRAMDLLAGALLVARADGPAFAVLAVRLALGAAATAALIRGRAGPTRTPSPSP